MFYFGSVFTIETKFTAQDFVGRKLQNVEQVLVEHKNISKTEDWKTFGRHMYIYVIIKI